MQKPSTYRYWKFVRDSEGEQGEEIKAIFREAVGRNALEQFWLGDWRKATEYALRIWDDPEFVKIEEFEAIRLIPTLLKVQEVAASQGAIEPEFVPMSAGEIYTNPLSSLTTMAVAMHELFLSFKAAGFNEDQALKLVGDILKRPQEPSQEAR